MENFKGKLIDVLKGREAVYSFLSRIFEKEIDREILNKYMNLKEEFFKYTLIPEINSEVGDGFKQLYNYLAKSSKRELDEIILELAVDYANLFLGVKYTREGKGIPHPSESVYMTGYMYQDERDEVLKAYLDEGLIKSSDFREPEDHIALELFFMVHLCKKAVVFLERENYQELLKNLKTQRKFLNEHLLKWAFKLANDIIKYAETDFYKASGKILKGFLNMERKIINNLIKEVNSLASVKE